MQRRQIFAIFFLLIAGAAFPGYAHDTFVTEMVSLNEPRSLDIALRPTYRVDKFILKSNTAIEYTDTVTRTDLNVRWAPTEKWETLVEIPFVGRKQEAAGGGIASSSSESGVGQVILGGKYIVCKGGGVAARVELPTGDKDDGLGEGFNAGILLLAEKRIGAVTAYLNVGYLIKTEYEAGTPKSKRDPGDLVQLNAALAHKRWGLNWVGEANANFIGKSKIAGKSVAGSDGTAIDLGLGIGKDFSEHWDLKGAVFFGAGEEAARSFDIQRGAGDYKFTLTTAYQFAY